MAAEDTGKGQPPLHTPNKRSFLVGEGVLEGDGAGKRCFFEGRGFAERKSLLVNAGCEKAALLLQPSLVPGKRGWTGRAGPGSGHHPGEGLSQLSRATRGDFEPPSRPRRLCYRGYCGAGGANPRQPRFKVQVPTNLNSPASPP